MSTLDLNKKKSKATTTTTTTNKNEKFKDYCEADNSVLYFIF